MANTITYDEGVKGWTSFHSFIPDFMSRLNNRFFTIKDGQLYLHNDEDNPIRNNFYGVQYETNVTFIINTEPSSIKVAKAFNIESNKAFDMSIKAYINDEESSIVNSTIGKSEFIDKEGKWYGYVRRAENNDLKAKNYYGIGRVNGVVVDTITFTKPIPKSLLSVGDYLYNEALTQLDKVLSYTDTTIVVDGTPTLTPGDFIVGGKNSRIEGSEIRGYNFEVTLTDTSTSRTELYAASCEVFKSNPS